MGKVADRNPEGQARSVAKRSGAAIGAFEVTEEFILSRKKESVEPRPLTQPPPRGAQNSTCPTPPYGGVAQVAVSV
jgi:hypothetical protein